MLTSFPAFTKHPDPLAPVLWLVVSRPGWGWGVGGCAGGGEERDGGCLKTAKCLPTWEWEKCVHGNQILFRSSFPTHSDLKAPKELMPRKMLQWSSRDVWMRVRLPWAAQVPSFGLLRLLAYSSKHKLSHAEETFTWWDSIPENRILGIFAQYQIDTFGLEQLTYQIPSS